MNKTKKSALGAAGVGVVALAMLGGGTFAAWSDFDTIEDNELGAGKLQLVVDHRGATQFLQPGNIAPGKHKFQDVYVASNDGESVPRGDLYVTLKNLVDIEDGCTNTNGEKAVDPDCGTPGATGDFSSQAKVELASYKPVLGQCRPESLIPKPINPGGTLLADIGGTDFRVATLAPGEDICIRVEVSLPMTATNAVQGDSAEFDAYFELVQVTS